MSDAAAKREARKRRILEKGGDRLSRLTNTGRGKDYEGLDTSPVAQRVMPREAPAVTTNATATSTTTEHVVERSAAPEGDDPFASMMAAVQARMGAEAPGGTMPTDPFALMQQVLNRGAQADPMAGAAGAASASSTLMQQASAEMRTAERSVRRLRLVQATLVFAFAFYIVFSSIFSHSHDTGLTGRSIQTDTMDEFARDTHMKQWASLAWEYTPSGSWLSKHDPTYFPWGAIRAPLETVRPYLGTYAQSAWLEQDLPTWSVFWVFVTMEMGLQGIRLALLQRMPATLPGPLDSVVSLYAPGLKSMLVPAASLMSLVSALVDDLCILLFAIGLGIVFCQVWTRS